MCGKLYSTYIFKYNETKYFTLTFISMPCAALPKQTFFPKSMPYHWQKYANLHCSTGTTKKSSKVLYYCVRGALFLWGGVVGVHARWSNRKRGLLIMSTEKFLRTWFWLTGIFCMHGVQQHTKNTRQTAFSSKTISTTRNNISVREWNLALPSKELKPENHFKCSKLDFLVAYSECPWPFE